MSIGRCFVRWVLWFVSVLLVVSSGCSDSPESGQDTSIDSTNDRSSSTTLGSTTTTTPATSITTTTTTTIDVFYSIAKHGLPPDPLPGSSEWFGSGCSPTSNTLPDGIWWGYVSDLSVTSVTFDLACLGWYDESDDDNPEDYGWDIENSNPKVRIVPVSLDTLVTCHWGHCPPNPLSYREWIEDDRLPHGEQGLQGEGGLWLYINNGVVTEIGDEVLAG